MSTLPSLDATAAVTAAPGYHGAVSDFKRRLIEATLRQMRGNRTHAARALGLPRTYLVRLIRELDVSPPLSRRPSKPTGGEPGWTEPNRVETRDADSCASRQGSLA